MVTIINYKERQKEDGTSFYVLEFQGGIEMIKNKKTFHIFAIVQSKRAVSYTHLDVYKRQI